MKDQWYGDNRDLIKWGGILYLCNTTGIKHVMQVAYYTKSSFPKLRFDRKKEDIREEVIEHFRDIEDIRQLGKKVGITIEVIKNEFSHSDRDKYNRDICKRIEKQPQRKIVFLDPDTGLATQNVKAKHVKPEEVSLIWKALKPRDFLVLYQHKPRMSDRITEWKNTRRKELVKALSAKESIIRMWVASEGIKDVVFYYCEKR